MSAFLTVKAVTLDAAGTLFFPQPSVGAIYSEIVAHYGVELEPDQLDSSFAEAFKSAKKKGSIEDPEKREWEYWRSIVAGVLEDLAELPENFDDLFSDLWTEFAKGSRWKLNPDARATFDLLEARGISCSLLTNWDQRVRRVIRDHNLESRFAQLFISSEVGFEKPDRQLFDFVATKMELSPNEILHVGDHLNQDYLGACNAGWNALLLTRKRTHNSDSRTIARLLDIQNHLQ
jgi:putative hydrolase of the HAD superfamily